MNDILLKKTQKQGLLSITDVGEFGNQIFTQSRVRLLLVTELCHPILQGKVKVFFGWSQRFEVAQKSEPVGRQKTFYFSLYIQYLKVPHILQGLTESNIDRSCRLCIKINCHSIRKSFYPTSVTQHFYRRCSVLAFAAKYKYVIHLVPMKTGVVSCVGDFPQAVRIHQVAMIDTTQFRIMHSSTSAFFLFSRMKTRYCNNI